MLIGTEVDIVSMADRREARVCEQQSLIERYWNPVISFCMNIPGPVKTTPEIRAVFLDAVSCIDQSLNRHGCPIFEKKMILEPTGDEYILCVEGKAEKIKEWMKEIEESHPLGRLFDIDVIGIDGKKLSRASYRRCLICGRQAQECARARAHTVSELQDRIEEMVGSFSASM